MSFLNLDANKADSANRVTKIIVQILHLMFVGTTLHTLQPFDCIDYLPSSVEAIGYGLTGSDALQPATLRVMDRYPKIRCDVGDEQYFRLTIMAVVGFIFYTLIYFAFVGYTVWKTRFLQKEHADYDDKLQARKMDREAARKKSRGGEEEGGGGRSRITVDDDYGGKYDEEDQEIGRAHV